MNTISHSNWIFRWAYLFSEDRHRGYIHRTDICTLFWRSVFLTPLLLLLLGAGTSILLSFIIYDWTEVARVVAGVIGISVAAAGLTFPRYGLCAGFETSKRLYNDLKNSSKYCKLYEVR